jgi:methionyl-tRNA formyltransferase
MNKINVVFCGYREWANSIFEIIEKHDNVCLKKTIRTIQEYKEFQERPTTTDIDLILFIGWSWIIPDYFTQKYLCLGIHPSDLPQYRGGSPLQNQIIKGVISSKVSLITLSSKLDAGDIWMKEDLSLIGDSIHNIFDNLIQSSIILLNNFFNLYPNINPQMQETSTGSYFKRRKPEDSKLTLDDLNKMTLKELYNFIRALTDPYPNAFIEDEDGNKLVFKNVSYIPSKESKCH